MIETGDQANLYNVESGNININGYLNEDMKHANGYSGCSEVFTQSHRLNMCNFPTTVHEGETSCTTGENKDKNRTSPDVHRQKHAEHQESYKRNICAYTASGPNDLKINENIYPTEKRHKSDLCDYSSKRSSHLKEHKLVHTGVKPYKCDICDYSTKRKGDLKTHKAKHSGEKPYKCDLCDYSSTTSGALKTHKLIHSGEKPYMCDICDYSSTTSGHLKTHKLIHTGEKPAICVPIGQNNLEH